MIDTISSQEYEGFCDFLQKTCGISLGENKQYLITSRLGKILDNNNLATLEELLIILIRDRHSPLIGEVVDAMTTNETFWFRDGHLFESFQHIVIPELAKNTTNPIRIWSAACSTGQEPYSISMVIDEYLQGRKNANIDVQITATDISVSSLAIAKAGLFDDRSLHRGISNERRNKHFTPVEALWEVKPVIKKRIEFKALNLLNNYAGLGRFDVIFCRNVLIYFSQDAKKNILTRMATSLKPGGYLFLGSSETISGYTDALEMQWCESGVIYRAKNIPKYQTL